MRLGLVLDLSDRSDSAYWAFGLWIVGRSSLMSSSLTPFLIFDEPCWRFLLFSRRPFALFPSFSRLQFEQSLSFFYQLFWRFPSSFLRPFQLFPWFFGLRSQVRSLLFAR